MIRSKAADVDWRQRRRRIGAALQLRQHKLDCQRPALGQIVHPRGGFVIQRRARAVAQEGDGFFKREADFLGAQHGALTDGGKIARTCRDLAMGRDIGPQGPAAAVPAGPAVRAGAWSQEQVRPASPCSVQRVLSLFLSNPERLRCEGTVWQSSINPIFPAGRRGLRDGPRESSRSTIRSGASLAPATGVNVAWDRSLTVKNARCNNKFMLADRRSPRQTDTPASQVRRVVFQALSSGWRSRSALRLVFQG